MKIYRSRVRYHRNGCFGSRFYLVEFEDHPQRKRAHRLLGIVFDASDHVAVVCPDKPLQCWRGDYYEEALRAAVVAAGDDVFKHSEET